MSLSSSSFIFSLTVNRIARQVFGQCHDCWCSSNCSSRRRHCYTFERQSGATCPPACCSQPVLSLPPFSTLLCLLFSCTILYTSYIIINNNSKIFFFKKGPKNRGRRWIIYKNISRRRRASTAFRSSYFSSVKCKFWFDFLFVSNFFLKKYLEMVCTKRKAKKKNDIPPIPPSSSWPPSKCKKGLSCLLIFFFKQNNQLDDHIMNIFKQ